MFIMRFTFQMVIGEFAKEPPKNHIIMTKRSDNKWLAKKSEKI